MSIDTLMDKMKPAVLENKTFDSEEKPKTFELSGILGPRSFRG